MRSQAVAAPSSVAPVVGADASQSRDARTGDTTNVSPAHSTVSSFSPRQSAPFRLLFDRASSGATRMLFPIINARAGTVDYGGGRRTHRPGSALLRSEVETYPFAGNSVVDDAVAARRGSGAARGCEQTKFRAETQIDFRALLAPAGYQLVQAFGWERAPV